MFRMKRSQEDEAIRRSPWSQNLDRKNESVLGVHKNAAFWAADDYQGPGWLHTLHSHTW
jgi:hypothetical protein